MSVINKMLRDLDSRQAAGKMALQVENSGIDIAQGTFHAQAPLSTGSKQGLTRFGIGVLVFFVLLIAAASGWWYLQDFPRGTVALPSTLSLPAKVVVPLNIVVPGIEPAVLADASLKMDSTFNWTERPEKLVHLKVATPPPVPLPAPAPVAPATQLNERVLQEKPVKPVVVPSVAATVNPQSPPRRAPALDALAQAQNLWNAGSRETAIELMNEALAVAERAHLAGSASGNNLLLSSLARELARMEMAEGRINDALKLLTRLEPALSGVADVWAMRGSAAQRLGKHEESVAAYRSALKLRPNEPRWMLGAAVSLAAQGQTDSAAELAEKARAAGVLSPEVAAYLRQLGVPLRER